MELLAEGSLFLWSQTVDKKFFSRKTWLDSMCRHRWTSNSKDTWRNVGTQRTHLCDATCFRLRFAKAWWTATSIWFFVLWALWTLRSLQQFWPDSNGLVTGSCAVAITLQIFLMNKSGSDGSAMCSLPSPRTRRTRRSLSRCQASALFWVAGFILHSIWLVMKVGTETAESKIEPLEQVLSLYQSCQMHILVLWCFIMFHDVSRCFMMFHDVSWCFMMFHDVSCFLCRRSGSCDLRTSESPEALPTSHWQLSLSEAPGAAATRLRSALWDGTANRDGSQWCTATGPSAYSDRRSSKYVKVS